MNPFIELAEIHEAEPHPVGYRQQQPTSRRLIVQKISEGLEFKIGDARIVIDSQQKADLLAWMP